MGKITFIFVVIVALIAACVGYLVVSGPQDDNKNTGPSSDNVNIGDSSTKEAGFAPYMTFDDVKDAPRGGTLRVGIQQEPPGLNPAFGSMMAKTEIMGCMFEEVVAMNDNWEFYPVLVESIPTEKTGDVVPWQYPGNPAKNEKPSEGMKVTWKFKQGLKWSDGHPLTPEDAIFTWQVVMSDDVQEISTRDLERNIAKMEIDANDPLVLHVYWKEKYAFYYMFSNYRPIPKHALENEFKTNPGKMHVSDFGRNPVCSGPYKVKEWMQGNHIILERNPNAPTVLGPAGLLDEIIYRFIPDTNALQTALVKGEIDAISPTGLGFDEAVKFKKREGDKFSLHAVNGMVWEHIDFNLDNPILQDKRVRHAVAHAVNRDYFSNVLFDGKQPVAHSWLPPKHYAFNDKLKQYDYNPEKAKQLLDEAGWKMEGEWRKKNGEKLQLSIMTTAQNRIREDIEVLIQNNLKQVGIDLIIDNKIATVFFSDITAKRQFPHMAMYAWIQNPTAWGSLWLSKEIPCEENQWLGQNVPGYRNAENDELLDQIPKIMSAGKRRELLLKQQEIWAEDLPSLPLYFRNTVSLTINNLRNWKETGTNSPISWNCRKWHFAK